MKAGSKNRFGGMLKTKTVHGVRTGNHSNPNVLRVARASGGGCGSVDGEGARPNFAKPGRMRRADGGPTISQDSKDEVAKLNKASNAELAGRGIGALGAGLALSAIGKKAGAGRFDRGLMGTMGGLHVLGVDGQGLSDRIRESERIRKGQAEPGREDGPKLRARGGGIMGRAKMRDGSKWKSGDATENESGKPYANGGAAGGKWIAGATKNKGALHKALNVPQGEKIPEKKLEKAENSDNPTMRKRAALAETLKGFKK